MMTETFKNMDSTFLKSMMKNQTGVEMSDAEINNIRNMMTPEMIQMMSNMNLDQMNLPSMGTGAGAGAGFGLGGAGAGLGGQAANDNANSGPQAMTAGLGGMGAQPSLSSILQNQGLK